MKKLNIQNESGRSMVEMLGVLAIIGVLSVGGIAGYTTAMRSHRANEIVNACSLLYVVANTKNESDDITYESVLGTRPTGVDELKYNNGTITAKITDAAICTEVKNKLGDRVTGDCAALAVTLGEVKEDNPLDTVACQNPVGALGNKTAHITDDGCCVVSECTSNGWNELPGCLTSDAEVDPCHAYKSIDSKLQGVCSNPLALPGVKRCVANGSGRYVNITCDNENWQQIEYTAYSDDKCTQISYDCTNPNGFYGEEYDIPGTDVVCWCASYNNGWGCWDYATDSEYTGPIL